MNTIYMAITHKVLTEPDYKMGNTDLTGTICSKLFHLLALLNNSVKFWLVRSPQIDLLNMVTLNIKL